MERQVRDVTVHYVEHGAGTPVLILHGANVDHREAEGCFEPPLRGRGGLRRIYPDLPGMGRTSAPPSLRSAADVLEVLLDFADAVAGDEPLALIGHSVGAYYGYGFAARRPDRVRGLALVCPLLPGVRDVPEHRPMVAGPDVGDEGFRSYFVIHTPAMFERYSRFVAPALPLADATAMERIGRRWQLSVPDAPASPGPTLVIAGRRDSIVGYAAAIDLFGRYSSATLAVLDGAGHALPHEQAGTLSQLLDGWLTCIDAAQ